MTRPRRAPARRTRRSAPAAGTPARAPADARLPWDARAVRDLRGALLAHYDAHRREMPWRGLTDPYAVWVSEVMLQQTRVETARERFTGFLGRFPTVRALARSTDADVLKAWEGLGYYHRARNLRRAAVEIETHHGGRLPDTEADLAALPGFGPYTSAAVASIAFARPVAVVDGNVARVMVRLLDEDGDPTRASTRARVAAAAARLLEPSRPGDWNQAVMDLGATICVPRKPACLLCPVAPWCAGRAAGRAERLPHRRKRRPVPHVEIAAGLVWRAGRLLVGRRPAEGLLGGLWEFPGGKREPDESLAEACAREIREETGLDVEVVELFRSVEHAYSHFTITLNVFHCRVKGGRMRARGIEDLRFVAPADLDAYAFPRANRKVLAALEASGPPPWSAAPGPGPGGSIPRP